MPISAVNQNVDARGVALLLTKAARESLAGGGGSSDRQRFLNNAYRLLNLYRSQTPLGIQPRAVSFPPTKNDSVALMPLSERHVEDVAQAMARALAETFGAGFEIQSLDKMESVLRGIADPAKFPEPSKEDREHTQAFFGNLAQHLQYAV